MFAHDDDHFDDAQNQGFSTTETNGDDDWQPATPAWRNRITSDADARGEKIDSDEGTRRRGTSIVSLGTAMSGTLRSEDPLYIEGEFEGEIVASSDVTIARGSNVNARVQAIRLTVAGKLTGNVACTDRFEVLETGEVTAEVLSPIFVVHDGATINGSLRMRLDEDEDLDPMDAEAGIDDER